MPEEHDRADDLVAMLAGGVHEERQLRPVVGGRNSLPGSPRHAGRHPVRNAVPPPCNGITRQLSRQPTARQAERQLCVKEVVARSGTKPRQDMVYASGSCPLANLPLPCGYAGEASMTHSDPTTGTSRVRVKPALFRSVWNSAAVRSRPLDDQVSMMRSTSVAACVAGEASTRSGRTMSTTSSVPLPAMAVWQACKMVALCASSQSCKTDLST